MILQPDFLDHHKTRKLVAMTGDPSAPLALIRLWSHCQASRAWEFPKLDKYDLASVCRWENPKISCERALVGARWVEKMSGGGYRVRNFDKWNKNLINNWERNLSGKAKDPETPDPAGTPRAPHREPDPINPIQSDNGRLDGLPGSVGVSNGSGLDGLVGRIAGAMNANPGPTLDEAFAFAQERYGQVWTEAEGWVRTWAKTMGEANWKDRKGKPIHDWKKHLVGYCDVAWRKLKGVKS